MVIEIIHMGITVSNRDILLHCSLVIEAIQ